MLYLNATCHACHTCHIQWISNDIFTISVRGRPLNKTSHSFSLIFLRKSRDKGERSYAFVKSMFITEAIQLEYGSRSAKKS